MSKKVLLIGGTGFIGSSIVQRLADKPFHIKILSRKERTSSNKQVQFIQGNLLDLESLVNAVKDVDLIIQAAQFPGHPVERPWLGKDHTYEGLDAQGTENVCQAIERVASKEPNKLKQYIYLSGAGVNQEGAKPKEINIEKEYASKYPWTRAKIRAEKAIHDTCSKVNATFTILRPSWVYGKGDQSMSKFILFARYLPFFPVIGDGTAPVNPVWVEDLSEIIINSIDNQDATNKAINIGSLPELTIKEVSQIVLEEVGVKKPIICHPKPLMKLGGLFAQFIPISPLSPNSVEFLTMDVHLKDLPESILGVKMNKLNEGLQKSGMLA